MKKLLFLLLASVVTFTAPAQQVRSNYRVDGMTHIATRPDAFKFGDVPATVKTELVGFPDGSTLYLLHITLEQAKKSATAAPKGVKMAVNLTSGKLIRLEQIGNFPTSQTTTPLKYAVETEDMELLVKGIKSVDIVTGWDAEDFLQATFEADEFASLLRAQCSVIRDAAPRVCEIKATLAERQENLNSILTTTNPLMARGTHMDYNILLSHLYYKNNGNEDIDLFFAIGAQEQFHIPFDSTVRFTLADGSEISLLQARDDVNFVLVYPSFEEISRMTDVGVTGLTIDCEGATLQDTFGPREDGADSFSDVLTHQLQLIYYISSL